jgi:hypothetical protein
MLQGKCRPGNCRSPDHDDGRMPEREHEPDGNWALSILHQFPGDIIDGCNMIRIDGVPQAEAIREECSPQKDRVAMEGNGCPQPRTKIEPQQDAVDCDYSTAQIIGAIVEQTA